MIPTRTTSSATLRVPLPREARIGHSFRVEVEEYINASVGPRGAIIIRSTAPTPEEARQAISDFVDALVIEVTA